MTLPLLTDVTPDVVITGTTRLRVAGRVNLSSRVVALDLVPADPGGVLEPWTAGAHVTLRLPSGLLRQYSLCGSPDQVERYRIAVLREEAGRGGSVEAHALAEGQVLEVSTPRNNFPLIDAPIHLLVAGGIGITPIAAKAHQLHRAGRPYRVVVALRSAADAGLISLLPAGCPVEVCLADAGGLDLKELLADVAPRTAVEVCGPARMLSEARSWDQALDRIGSTVNIEQFEAATDDLESIHSAGDRPFTVTFARSGEQVRVEPGTSILSQAREIGKIVESSCEEGYCGTCETAVLSGIPDHRDDFLTPSEQEDGRTMMLCVSRCAGPELVLDL